MSNMYAETFGIENESLSEILEKGKEFFEVKINTPKNLKYDNDLPIFFIAYYVFYSTEPTSQSWLFLIFGVLPDSMLYYGDYYPLFPFFFCFSDNQFPMTGKKPDKHFSLPWEIVELKILPIFFIMQSTNIQNCSTTNQSADD